MRVRKPVISVIIVDYKAKKYLPNCLTSIEKHINVAYEIIVVDNNKVNRGFSKAANRGAQKAYGQYLLFLNPDTIVNRGDFKKLVAYLEKHPKIGITGLKMVLEDGSLQPYSFGNKCSLLGAVRQKLGIAKKPNRASPDWVSGGAMVVKNSLFEKLGGFDEQFFMYFEDQDLCLRAKRLGFAIKLWEDIAVTHFGGVPKGGGSHGNRKKQIAMYRASQLKFMAKYLFKKI